MDITSNFALLLRQARVNSDLTQEALAEAVSCATQTIRSLEVGRRRPSREMAARLADVLQIPETERAVFLRLARAPLASRDAEVSDAEATPATVGALPRQPSAPRLPPDELIGRQTELEHLRQALFVEGHRLVTLLGPGGIGKTRLALQTSADLAASFANGAAFVALASVADAGNMVTTIAEAVGCALSGVPRPDVALLDFLSDQELLLTLDNLEQLLVSGQGDQVAALLVEVLRVAPGVRLLVTSRERLRMRGEQVIVIDGLALPEGRRGAAVERASAAMLFLERARQVSSNFTITTKNYEAISRICRLVAGVPLAIELAASWVHVLSCEEIAAEIARGVDFLSVSNRDLPPRHRSLRAVIDHSWQLLTDEERDLLAHLSIFQGGARREAISVVRGDAQGGSRLLLLLAALVDKSLVRQSIGADGVTRYDLHEFVRQYAAERLAEDPATWTRAVSAHAAYYADWLAEQETRLKSERQKATVLSIISEIAHVRAAWNWACDRQDAQMLRQMLPTLDWFYELRGWYVEATAAFGRGAQALKPLIETTDDEGIHTCYWLMFGREGFHTLRRDPVFAVQRLRDSVAMLRQVSQHGEQIHCIKGLAYITMFAGDYTRAQALLEEARSIATAREDHWNLAMTLVIRGALEALRSEAVTARQHLDDALAVARTVGDPRPVSTALTYLGLTSLAVGEIDQAERGCREAHILAADHQDRFQMSLSLQALGRVALAKGEYSEADWLFNESLATAREIGDRWMEAQALGCLSALAGATGDGTRARELRRSAVSIADRAPTAIALAELAALAVLELDVHPDAALIALAFVQEHPLTQPATRATAASNWARAAEMVGEAQLIAAQTAAQLRVNERPSALLALFPPL